MTKQKNCKARNRDDENVEIQTNKSHGQLPTYQCFECCVPFELSLLLVLEAILLSTY